MKLLCRLGLHHWKKTPDGAIWWPVAARVGIETRYCQRCGHEQWRGAEQPCHRPLIVEMRALFLRHGHVHDFAWFDITEEPFVAGWCVECGQRATPCEVQEFLACNDGSALGMLS
jgi:hypothetical protein